MSADDPEGATSVSIIVATLRRTDRLRGSLRSLMQLEPAPTEIIVVDGDDAHSAKPLVAELSAASPSPIRWVGSAAGLTRQRNVGLAAAHGDVVVFVDDDVQLESGALGALLTPYRDPAVVGVAGNVVEPVSNTIGGKRSRLRALLPGGGRQGEFTRYGYPHRLRDPRVPRDVQLMQGCFMSARTDDACAIGFDEALAGYGLAEDEDFSWRLAQRGRIRYEPGAVVFHDNTGFGDRDRRVFNRTVVTHRAYLFRKNFPQTRLARAQFRMLISALVVHRLVNGDLAGMRGLYDGMQALRRGQSPGAVREASGRVLFVSSHAGGGGSERYLAQLLERLPSRTIDAVVALQAGPLIERLRHNAVDVSVVSTGPSALAILAAAWKLRRTVRRRRSRLIHANGVKAAAVAVTAVRGLDIPVVWVKHDHSFDGRIARWIARRCSLVVGVSRSVLRSVEATSATRVVAPGIAVPPVERASARAELSRLVGRGRVVLLVGRLDRAKGHDQAIEVIARVRQRVADARLVFVGAPEAGQPEYADQLAELAIARGVGEAVTVLGYRDDAQRLIRGADALLIMSRATGRRGAGSEGHPLVAVEALTLGTPVLGYAIGGLPEVVGECGVLVAPGDLVALSDALVGLLEDDERRRCLSDCGRARASRFDPGSTASAMSEIYRELMPR